MRALDALLPEVARNEGRAIHLFDHDGRQQTFLFREYYCDEAKCDCRRVVLIVEWIEGARVAATINYAFEPPPPRYGEPQIFLDPLNPQSPHSEVLLKVFTQMIGEDAAYRERLTQHYAQFKAAVGRRRKERAKPKRAAVPASTGSGGELQSWPARPAAVIARRSSASPACWTRSIGSSNGCVHGATATRRSYASARRTRRWPRSTIARPTSWWESSIAPTPTLVSRSGSGRSCRR